MVRNYTTEELLSKVKSLPSYKNIPNEIYIIGVRSKEDKVNVFDDKFYIFKGEKFLFVLSGTTNSGLYGLLNFGKWQKRGVAHVKSNEWYYDVWRNGLHKGRMPALVQVEPFKIIRDNNRNYKSGDIANWTWENWIGINFHANNYNLFSRVIRWNIGAWSVGCQVTNNLAGYRKLLDLVKKQARISYVLIDED